MSWLFPSEFGFLVNWVVLLSGTFNYLRSPYRFLQLSVSYWNKYFLAFYSEFGFLVDWVGFCSVEHSITWGSWGVLTDFFSLVYPTGTSNEVDKMSESL